MEVLGKDKRGAMRLKSIAALTFLALGAGFAFSSIAAKAEPIRIVALGASNTNGADNGPGQAWPAQLEAMLKAKGYDVNMTVSAVNGDTSAGILSRASSAIAPGTQVVIFDLGTDNDRKKGLSPAETKANKAQILSVIRSRGAKALSPHYAKIAGAQYASAGYQANGYHLTATSHARIAAALVPQVIAAVGRKK